MKKILKSYNDERYEIFCEANRYIVKDKEGGKYYKLSEEDSRNLDFDFIIRDEKISSTFFYIIMVFLVLAEILNIYILLHDLNVDVKLNEIEFIYALLIYLPSFIIIHEFGHIFCFSCFGRKIDKIGFKINYIFPSFFVRMNDVHLLSKKERIVVHSGGLLFSLLVNNCLFFSGIILKNIILIYLSRYMAVDIIFNSLPLMNSDGYKVILAIRGIDEVKYFQGNTRLIKAIKLINVLLAIIYTIWFVWSL